MNWVELLTNPVVIRSIYGEVIPSLSGVDIHEFRLHREGASAMIRFNLSEFPEDPPKKWVSSGLDTVQIELSIDEIDFLSIREWRHTMIADLSVERIREDCLRIHSSPVPDCTILSRWISVSKIGAYRQSMRE